MNKRNTLLITLIFVFNWGFAQQINQSEALERARIFFGTNSTSPLKASSAFESSQSLELAYTGGTPAHPAYYIYNVGTDNGFVVVAAVDGMKPILAYTLYGKFEANDIDPVFKTILDEYEEEANYLRTKESKSKKSMYASSNDITPLGDIIQVGPYTSNCLWHQYAPYNNLCPTTSGGGHYLAGCVAVAGAITMKYYGYPESGKDSKNGFNFGATTYQWDKMLLKYDDSATEEQKNAVAELIAHIGAAVDMNYALGASGSTTRDLGYALVNNFKYPATLNMATKSAYTEKEWDDKIKQELDERRPVIFSGFNANDGGHAFIVDGYDSEGRYSLNLGHGYAPAWVTFSTMEFKKKVLALVGISPTNEKYNPEVILASSVNLSKYNLTKNAAFSAGVRLCNYSLRNFNGTIGLALYRDNEFVTTVCETKANIIACNNDNAMGKIVYTTVEFSKAVIPNTVENGIYTLQVVVDNGIDWNIIGREKESLIRTATVVVNGKNVSITYPEAANWLSLDSKMEMTAGSSIGKFSFRLKNSNPDYNYKGNLFILAKKDGMTTPVLIANQSIEVEFDDVLDVVMEDVYLKTGKYTYYVAFNPEDKTGSEIWGTIPLLPASNNFETYNAQPETVDYTMDFTTLTAVPSTYKEYKDNTETSGIWIYNAYYKANSVLYEGSEENSHTLITEKLTVRDENTVLEWAIGNKISEVIPYEIYVSTVGQEITNFTQAEMIYKKDLVTREDFIGRISLAKYAGQDVYIAFKHLKADLTAMHFNSIKLLNIPTPKDISIIDISFPKRVLIGTENSLKVTVKNHSPKDIKEFKASYALGESIYTETIACNIGYNQTYTFTFSKPIGFQDIVGTEKSITVSIEMDDEDPASLDNNVQTVSTVLCSFMPRKMGLVYKAVKKGCPACLQLYTRLDELEEDIPGQLAGLEIWLNLTNYSCPDFSPYETSTTPTFDFNNKYFCSGDVYTNNVVAAIDQMDPPASVDVEMAYVDKTSRTMKVKVRSKFAFVTGKNYRLGAFVFENNVNAAALDISGNLPGRTKGHLPVAALGGCKGVDGYLITNPKPDEIYEYEWTYTLPAETSLRYKRDEIQVIGVLFDESGEIQNCNLNEFNLRLNPAEGVVYTAEEGYSAFKEVKDVIKLNSYTLQTRYRATVANGKDFRFRATAKNGKKVLVYLYTTKTSKRLLEPDLDGAYTISHIDRHYLLESVLTDEEDTRPIAQRNGTEISLSKTWKATDFSKLDLTDQTLTAVDMTNIVIPENAVALVPANPNLLIYTAWDAVVPESWRNVVKGKQADEITLKDGFSFCNTKEFTAGRISYTRTYPVAGWSSLCLPFSVRISELVEAGISLEEYTGSEGSVISFKPVTSDVTLAQMPYIALIEREGEVVFSSEKAIILANSTQDVVFNDYTFKGTFIPINKGNAAGLFFLNPSGKGFVKGTETSDISPFRAYIKGTAVGSSATRLSMVHEGSATSIRQIIPDSFHAYSTKGNLIVIATKAMNLNICSIDGKRVKRILLHEGINTISGLAKGLYLANNKKVFIQ